MVAAVSMAAPACLASVSRDKYSSFDALFGQRTCHLTSGSDKNEFKALVLWSFFLYNPTLSLLYAQRLDRQGSA